MDGLSLFGIGTGLMALGSAGAVAATLMPSPAHMRLLSVLPRPGGRPHTHGRLVERPLRTVSRLTDRLLGRTRTHGRETAIAVCRVFASELRAGRPPTAALERSAAEAVEAGADALAPVAAAARSGADPAEALRRAGAAPGMAGLAHLAACWAVASRSGAGLAEVSERLADSLSQEEERRRELSAQLAGPRTTAVLLALLPAAGLGLSSAMGAGPIAFLFTTPVGLACLAGGVLLDAVGLWWTNGMVRKAVAALEGE
ncbi:type II secretion system F family protein [Nocardiopsis suaedae]|uniref:Type II secretion system F family protein n=1 Tax=Nocardiopsis suaedae TaxID=3018444 RepID=A0ABT4TU48_9ACTN|nr:type II secretion system F family protein [Nocardiopsis suaedae]MDA2808223.1 type II secretion system F family protein [Nocardiopsis suaedae]